MDTIYRRTSKGNEEIKLRTFKLDHEHRFVLIMVDGNASADSIISRSSVQWNPIQCLFELETKGFIENVDSQANTTSDIGILKQDLIIAIQKQLPKNNTKIVNKILNAELNSGSITKAINSGCMFIQLTISEEIAKTLKTELLNIAKNSSEI